MTENELADIYKALSVPSRLRILKLIGDRSLCVNAITHMLDISQPAVSQHLSVLKKVGLVKGERNGYMIHYAVDREKLEAFKRGAADVLGESFISVGD
jgi:DNA-binding transcriptional ArsR family regulator